MSELMPGIKPPKKKELIIQGRFLDGPLEGKTLTHTTHENYQYPTLDGVVPPYVWPITIDSMVEKLEYKLTVEGLHEPLKVLPADFNKQQRYHILYWEDNGRVHPKFGIIGTYRRVGVYKLTVNPVSNGFTPAWTKTPYVSKAHPTSSAPTIVKKYHKNNPDEWAPIDWDAIAPVPGWVPAATGEVDQHKWLTVNDIPLEELLDEGSEDEG